MTDDRTFNCLVIAPDGKLLDCRTSSVVFPAYDGQVGVWYNHEPMFCKLGLGIMQVKRDDSEDKAADVSLLVDGGFAVICSNLLKVVSYDAVYTSKHEAIEQMIAGIKRKLATRLYDQQEREHRLKKIALLDRLLELLRHPQEAHDLGSTTP